MAFLACMVTAPLFAQFNLNMPFNTGPVSQTVTALGGNFFDNGGAGGAYSNGSGVNSVVTFIPGTAGQRVAVTFTTFSTEAGWDPMYIFNGTDVNQSLISTASTGNMIPCTALGPNGTSSGGFPGGGFWGTQLQGRKVFSTSADGRLTFRFRSDASVTLAGWVATVVQEVPCAPIAPANVVVGVGPNCGPNSATLTVPAIPACAVSLGYSVDGGPILPAVPPTVTTAPLAPGIHTIRWFALEAGGCPIGNSVSTVNVLDIIPPTIVCPASATYNLDAGECNQIVNYNLPVVSDNCPWGPGGATLATTTASGNGNSVGGMVFFDLNNLSTGPLNLTQFGMNITAGTQVQIYYKSGSHVGFETNAGAWTTGPLADATVGPFSGAFPGNGTITPAIIGGGGLTIPTGVTGIGLRTLTASSNYTNGANTYTNGTLTITTGYASNGLFIAGFTPRTFNGSVTYQTVVPPPPATQTAGLPSGSTFPVGTTTNCFSITDFAGNTSSCCFDINVIAFPNPTQQLVCNDNVQVSLDQQCTAAIGADDILEGGLYGCYDTRYTVMIVTPMGGLVSPAVVDRSYIGNGPHTVKVVDNVTGQSCWGTIIVEDKLAPVMVCRDLNVDCSADLFDPAILAPAPFVFDPQAPIQFPASFVAHGGGLAFNLQGNGLAQGDYFNLTNTSAGPIKVQGFGLRTPDPAFGAVPSTINFNVWTRPTTFVGFETSNAGWTNEGSYAVTPIPAYFTTGTGPLAQLVLNADITIPAGATVAFHLFSPNTGLVFNYTFGVQPPVVNGILTLLGGPSSFGEFGPLFNPGANTVPNIQVNYAIELQPIPVLDNCAYIHPTPPNPTAPNNDLTYENGGLTFVDNFTDGVCGGVSGTVTRTWTATDNFGNHVTCAQVITIERPTLDDVDLPADVQWTCEQYDAFPNVIEPTHLHRFITDTDLGTDIINVNLDPNCDDLDLNLGTPNTQDNPLVNATNIANGGLGCPGSNPFNFPVPNNGLDDADVLALTGSGVPTVGGLPLKSLCEISYEWEDLEVNVCAGTFKIIRRWTLIDWCANPVDVRHFDQLIKVVDDKAPQIDLFAVAGETTSNYGTHDIPALGDGGGCNQEPQLSGGTQYLAHVQLPQSLTPEAFNNVRLQKVWLEVDHARLSDLDIYLRAPNGITVELTSNNGGNGTSIAADFYDAAPGNVTLSQFNTIGDFRPEGSNATSCGGFGPTYDALGNLHNEIADFDNPNLPFAQDVLGNWELIVFDEVAQATGKVVSWKLFFTYASLNIDVYDAATPQNNGAPHAVCQGTVVVPPIDGYDNCSGVAGYTTELWTIVPGSNPALPMTQLGTVAGNGGAFFNVPLFANGANARYIVRYYAIDGCNNQAFVDAVITLRDKVPPVPVCVEYTEISITNDGLNTGTSCSRLWAEDLDKASYDNCKPVYFLMAKMSDATSQTIFNRCYYPYRDFCCDDLGNQQVILLVLDQDPAPFFSTLNSAPLGCDGTPGLFLSNNFGFNTSGLNFNTCMVDVQVTDKLPPVLVACPPNQRITCDWYADNLETQLAALPTAAAKSALLTSLNFGVPTYFDNCAVTITPNFSVSLDQCLEGTITRSWTAVDGAGNSAVQPCQQVINVDHVSDWAVEFPVDITVNCGGNVPGFGEPEIFYETCELIATTYDDEQYTVQGTDACYKIVRQWTVINWCVVGTNPGVIDQEVVEQPENQLGLPFPQCDVDSDGDCDNHTYRDSWRSGPANPNRPSVVDATRQTNPDTDLDTDPWDGYITFQQVIKVQDNIDPVFTNGCAIPDVCIQDNTCGATVILPEPEITECTDDYTVSVQIKIGGVWLNGFGPYVNVAPGTYEVRYVAHDFCNNQTQCTTTVTVKDCKKPTPYCKNGLVIELMVPSGMVDTWASDFDAGSFDNCPGTLKLSFSANVNDIGNTYTCDDLGQQPVQIWVTDAAGNQDYCETFVIIQANMGQCEDDPLVAGTVATEDDLGVDGVHVNVNSPSGFDGNGDTDNGAYGLTVPAGGDYTVTPAYDENPLNGVSTFDLVLISKHILGVTPLGSPYKIIAADANKSNSVTTFDLVAIRKLILFIDTEFQNNTSWRFVDASFNFPNAGNPFATAFPEVINLNDVTADVLDNDFVAVKVGDVNGSAAVNLLGTTGERNTVGDLVLNADDMELEAGREYTVEFKATDFNVSGYQFSLNFDARALEFVGVAPAVAGADNFGTTMAKEGVLTASWNSDEAKRLATGDVVFGLTFKAVQGGRLSGMMDINSSYTVAEAYSGNNELLNVALSFNNNLVTGEFGLYQNTPNPFASVTTIGFYLPEATSATLTISDVQGKVVKVIKGEYSKGYNTVKLNRSDVGAAGVLSYRLDSGSNSATRKMILVD